MGAIERGESVKKEYTIIPSKHGVKLMLNGFPKSGLHLLALMCGAFLRAMEDEMINTIWSGINGAWDLTPLDLNDRLYKLSRLGDGELIFSHSVYNKKLADFLWYCGTGVVFIYRDPRDVAVSQTFHVLSDDDALSHPDKQLYRDLGSFDAALEAVIVGIGKYPGVMARWEHYHGWLDVPWVLPVRFEDLRIESVEWAERIFSYALNRLAMMFHRTVEVEPESLRAVAEKMVELGNMTDKSSTFRAGRIGDWRSTFTERHVQLFKESDTGGWVEKLGYKW